MKRLLLSTLLVGLSLFAYCQEISPDGTNYITNGGYEFNTGDSLYIGIASQDNYFDYLWQYQPKSKTYQKLDKSFQGCSESIKGFFPDKKKYFGSNSSQAIVEAGQYSLFSSHSIFGDMENAIKSGEIILSREDNKSALERKTPEFNDTVAFASILNHSQKDPYTQSQEYIFRFDYKVYKKYYKDEFAFEKQKEEATTHLKSLISKIDNTGSYWIDVTLQINRYDFKNASFPIEWNTDTLYSNKKENLAKVIFDNEDAFSLLSVKPDQANALVKRRTLDNGTIDRKIYARIYFNNLSVPSDDIPQKSEKSQAEYPYFHAHIFKVVFFDFPDRDYNYIGQISLP